MNTTLLRLSCAVALAATVATPATASARAPQDPAPADGAIVSVTKTSGSACDLGTPVHATMVESNATIAVTYDTMTVESGPGISPKQATRTCQADVELQAPAGYAVAVNSLTNGAVGLLKYGAMAERTLVLTGPDNTLWGKSHVILVGHDGETNNRTGTPVSLPELVYSPCGGTLKMGIATLLRLFPGASYQHNMVTTHHSHDISTGLDLAWKKCDAR